jgi:hypothetical protein
VDGYNAYIYRGGTVKWAKPTPPVYWPGVIDNAGAAVLKGDNAELYVPFDKDGNGVSVSSRCPVSADLTTRLPQRRHRQPRKHQRYAGQPRRELKVFVGQHESTCLCYSINDSPLPLHPTWPDAAADGKRAYIGLTRHAAEFCHWLTLR